MDEVLAIFGPRRRMAVEAYIELMARGEGHVHEDLRSIGQVVKGEEEFAFRRFEEAGGTSAGWSNGSLTKKEAPLGAPSNRRRLRAT